MPWKKSTGVSYIISVITHEYIPANIHTLRPAGVRDRICQVWWQGVESVVSKWWDRREGDKSYCALIEKVTGAIILFMKKRVCSISVFLYEKVCRPLGIHRCWISQLVMSFLSSVFLASYLIRTISRVWFLFLLCSYGKMGAIFGLNSVYHMISNMLENM